MIRVTRQTPSRGYFSQTTSLLGLVEGIGGSFSDLQCRSENLFHIIHIKCDRTINFTVLRNIDDLNRDRVPNPPDYDPSKETSEAVLRTGRFCPTLPHQP